MTVKVNKFRMPSNGVEIIVPAVSLVALTIQARRKYPEPEPALVTVNVAGVATKERHYNEEYLQAHKAWEDLVNFTATTKALDRIAMAQHLTDEQKAAVCELREIDPDIHSNDKMAWFYNFAIGNDADIHELIPFATSQVDPQEARIKATANGF